MGLITRTADLFYTFRFLKLLVTPWDKTPAFEQGILDARGKLLKHASELKTDKEKTAYTMFDRLVFNIKRLLEMVPFGKSRIASYAAALYLIKENTGMSDEAIQKIFEKMEVPIESYIVENTWFLNEEGSLQPGSYTLVNDVPFVKTGEFRARMGSRIHINKATKPAGRVLDIPVFFVEHPQTGQTICVSTDDISR